MIEHEKPQHLIVEADGGSRGNPGPAGYGALVRVGDEVLAERAEFIGTATNNVAEYRGLVAGLEAAAEINPNASVSVRMDSKLVVQQMSGVWKIKHPDMRELAAEARQIFPSDQLSFEWIPRAKNSAADALANEAMDGGPDTNIARDFAAEEPEEPPSPTSSASPAQLTWLALVTPGAAPIAALRSLGHGALAHVPMPSHVVAAATDTAKACARDIAAGLKIAATARELNDELGERGNHEGALNRILTTHGGKTVVAVCDLGVVQAALKSAEFGAGAVARLELAPGSVTVIGYEGDSPARLVMIGAVG